MKRLELQGKLFLARYFACLFILYENKKNAWNELTTQYDCETSVLEADNTPFLFSPRSMSDYMGNKVLQDQKANQILEYEQQFKTFTDYAEYRYNITISEIKDTLNNMSERKFNDSQDNLFYNYISWSAGLILYLRKKISLEELNSNFFRYFQIYGLLKPISINNVLKLTDLVIEDFLFARNPQ